jgi:hypothetical protein
MRTVTAISRTNPGFNSARLKRRRCCARDKEEIWRGWRRDFCDEEDEEGDNPDEVSFIVRSGFTHSPLVQALEKTSYI